MSSVAKDDFEVDENELSSFKAEPSTSSISPEVLTSSESFSTILPTFIAASVTDSVDDVLSSQPVMVESLPSLSGQTLSPEAQSLLDLTTVDAEGSGKSTTDLTNESLRSVITMASVPHTPAPSLIISHETLAPSEPALTAATSLYSTEQLITLSEENQWTVGTSGAVGQPATVTETSAEEGSGELMTEMISKDTSSPTVSSLFSTEKPTPAPLSEKEMTVTKLTETSPLKPVTEWRELSSTFEEGSGLQTLDAFNETFVSEKTLSPETQTLSVQTVVNAETSGETTMVDTSESFDLVTTIASVSHTQPPIVTTPRETSVSSVPTVTAASSLYSTEKPIPVSEESQASVSPSGTDRRIANVDDNSAEQDSGEHMTEKISKYTVAPTASSLSSTEKQTSVALSGKESAFTKQTETSPLKPVSERTELSSLFEEGSGLQALDSFSQISSVTDTVSAHSTAESYKISSEETDEREISSSPAERLVSSISPEVVTSSVNLPPRMSTVTSTSVTDSVENMISSQTGMVDYFPSSTLSPETQSLSVQTAVDADGSGETIPDPTSESLILITTMATSSDAVDDISSQTPMVESLPFSSRPTLSPETQSFLVQTAIDVEGSGETTDVTRESLSMVSTMTSVSHTQAPAVTLLHETVESSKPAVTAASSLYSTEKPTPVSDDTVKGSTAEESSSQQLTEMISENTVASTASSLFSTEKPTSVPLSDKVIAVSMQTDKISTEHVISREEQSLSIEEGSGPPTLETFIHTSPVTDKVTAHSTAEPKAISLVNTDEQEITFIPMEQSVSSISLEEVTNTGSVSTRMPTILATSISDFMDDIISSQPAMVESVPFSGGPSLSPVTQSLSVQIPIDAEGSGETTADVTSESLILATTMASVSHSQSHTVATSHQTSVTSEPAVNATSSLYSTEKSISVSEESQLSESTSTGGTVGQPATMKESSAEEGSGEQVTEMINKDTAPSTTSSLFTTEKPTLVPFSEKEIDVTKLEKTLPLKPVTEWTEPSSTFEEGSGFQTPIAFTQTSTVAYTGGAHSTAETKEISSVTMDDFKINEKDLPSLKAESSAPSTSPEVLTSSESFSTILPTFMAASVTDSVDDVLSSQPVMVESLPSLSGPILSPEAQSLLDQTTVDAEGSGETTTVDTNESFNLITTMASVSYTLAPAVPTSHGTSAPSQPAVTAASSLFSTEKAITVPSESQLSLSTTGIERLLSTVEGSSAEDGSGEQVTEMIRKDIASPTGSSLFSTEKTTSALPFETETVVTKETEMSPIEHVSEKIGESSAFEEGSGLQTLDAFTQTSSDTDTVIIYSTAEPKEITFVKTDAEEISTGPAQPSVSSISPEEMTSSVIISTRMPTITTSESEFMDGIISSQSSIVESFSSSSGPTLSPETQSLPIQTAIDSEGSGETTTDVTSESMTLITIAASVSYTQAPAVTAASSLYSTEKPILVSEESQPTSSTSGTERQATTVEGSLPEAGSGEMISKDIASPTVSSLFSTEKPTTVPFSEKEIAVTKLMETFPLKPVTKWTEPSSTFEEGSGLQTLEVLSVTPETIESGLTLNPQTQTQSVQTSVDAEGSGETTTVDTNESFNLITTMASVSYTLAPAVPTSHGTSAPSQPAVTAASSLFSTEKAITVPSESQLSLSTTGIERLLSTVEGSSAEDGSGEQVTEMIRKDIASPTGSSLFSTEKTTSALPFETETVVTKETEMSPIEHVSEKIGESSAFEEGSGLQTLDAFTQTSSETDTVIVYSTAEPKEITFVKTDAEEISTGPAQPSVSSISPEEMTSSVIISTRMPTITTSESEFMDGIISSQSSIVESFSSSSGPTLSPETQSLPVQTAIDSEGSGETTTDVTSESMTLITIAASVSYTQAPAVTAASSLYSTEKPIPVSEESQPTSSTSGTERQATTVEGSLPEAGSGEMISKDIASPTVSSLFSTEKPTTVPFSEKEIAVTKLTETFPLKPVTKWTEPSSTFEEGSGLQTLEVLSVTPETIESDLTLNPQTQTQSVQTSVDAEGSGETTTVDTNESFNLITTMASVSYTLAPAVPTSHGTSAPSQPAVTAASSLFSTEKAITVPSESQLSLSTTGIERLLSTVEGSSAEDGSGEQVTEMIRKDIASPTGSSLFSTEKTTSALPFETETVVTKETEMSPIEHVSEKIGESSAFEEGSGLQTLDAFTQTSSDTDTVIVYSTAEPKEITFVKTDAEEISTGPAQPSVSSISPEEMTSSVIISTRMPTITTSESEFMDEIISSQSSIVESFSSSSGPTLSPETQSLPIQTAIDSEGSGETTTDVTSESMTLITIAASVSYTQAPAVTAASSLHSTEKPIPVSEESQPTSSTSGTERQATTVEGSLPEAGSGEMISKDIASPTVSSLFSTEKPTTVPFSEKEIAVTKLMETFPLKPVTKWTEPSSTFEEGSGLQTLEVLSVTPETIESGLTLNPQTQTQSVQTSVDAEGSGEITTVDTNESFNLITTMASVSYTQAPAVPTSHGTSAPSQPAVTAASSLFSTEKAITVPSESQLSLSTTGIERLLSTVEGSSAEDGSGEQVTEMIRKDIASPTGSSLFSTEKTTSALPFETETVVTKETEMSPIEHVSEKIGESSAFEEGSGLQTLDAFTQTSSETDTVIVYSTAEPKEITFVKTDAEEISSGPARPSVSSISPEEMTSSVIISTRMPSITTNESEFMDGIISSQSSIVESFSSSSGPTLSPETQSLPVQTAIDSEGSGESTTDLTSESMTFITIAASVSYTQAPAVTAASSLYSTEKPIPVSEESQPTSSTSGTERQATTVEGSLPEERSAEQLTEMISTDLAKPTASSPTQTPVRLSEKEGAVTKLTETSPVKYVTDRTEQSSIFEEGSGLQTLDTFTQISAMTETIFAHSTAEPKEIYSSATYEKEHSSITAEPLVSSISPKVVTSSISLSPRMPTIISSSDAVDDISSQTPMVESLPFSSRPALSPETQSFLVQTAIDVEGSGETTDVTRESLSMVSTMTSVSHTQAPAVTTPHQTHVPSTPASSAASSLYSTEKSIPVSEESQPSIGPSWTDRLPSAKEGSSAAESSGEQVTEMISDTVTPWLIPES
ncbi:uncharacterized protein LOC142881084 [Nelusetta ayraudi]|uniref:uncharacterized protein LOC142881084 n=1 Tax=Nelusetta ayraudi TaxID=303726 RepID=UPI003F6EDE37